MTRVAAIDCGTNTIRLLIAEADRDQSGRPRLEVLRRRNEIVRLGQGVDRTGMLDPEALERTLRVVAAYAADCDELGVAPGEAVRRFVATSATRDASNREDFVAGVRRLLGVEPEVVSGQEEARLSFSGSLLGARGAEGAEVQGRAGRAPAPRLVVDLGGGSTELVLGMDEPSAAISLDTGSVRITERFLSSGVTVGAEAAARAEVRGLLDDAERVVDLSAPGRRDVIAAGALVWSEVVTRVVERTTAAGRPLERVTTSLYDILDGIALSLVPAQAGPEGDEV